MPTYAELIHEMIPIEFYKLVFAENARTVFGERMRG